MLTRLLVVVAASVCFLGFLLFPNLDTFILALPMLMVFAVWSEEIWERFYPPDFDLGPKCFSCGYDVRATPVRCPECGTPLRADLVQRT